MDEGFSEEDHRLWRLFLSASTRLLERLDHELQQRSQLSLTDFDILSMLSGAPSNRLRMSELAEQVLVSRSRLTYRVDRLAELDYVTRQECEDDRRGLFAILTDNGAKALAAAAPGHVGDIRDLLWSLVKPEERAVLTEVLARVDGNLSTY